MPGIIRCQAVFQGATNLAEDRFINTFHAEWFGALTSYDEAKVAWAGAVESFYLFPGPNGRPLNELMSPFISGMSVVTYNMDLPEGEREPWVQPGDLWEDSAGGPSMPEEVAICVTLHGVPPITPRRRGRIFFGPLLCNANVATNANDTEPTRVNLAAGQTAGESLVWACTQLMNVADLTWAIRSVTPTENYVPIVGGWIDNAFDTQRRRGPDPTARVLWPAP